MVPSGLPTFGFHKMPGTTHPLLGILSLHWPQHCYSGVALGPGELGVPGLCLMGRRSMGVQLQRPPRMMWYALPALHAHAGRVAQGNVLSSILANLSQNACITCL